jgi:hypothetical protein
MAVCALAFGKATSEMAIANIRKAEIAIVVALLFKFAILSFSPLKFMRIRYELQKL